MTLRRTFNAGPISDPNTIRDINLALDERADAEIADAVQRAAASGATEISLPITQAERLLAYIDVLSGRIIELEEAVEEAKQEAEDKEDELSRIKDEIEKIIQ